MKRCLTRLVPLFALLLAAAQPGLAAAAARHPDASTTVCAVYCDTRDPSLAGAETFPEPNVDNAGRVIELHVDDADGMAWGSIDDGQLGDSVWLDRSWDGGQSFDGPLGEASIPSTWTGTRTLMYNLYDPVGHRRGLLRACGQVGSTVMCTDWAHQQVCAAQCDGISATSGSAGDYQPVAATSVAGRNVQLHMDDSGMAWATIDTGTAGDAVWLDRSWNEGSSWPDGSQEGLTNTPSGATGTATVKINTDDTLGRLYGGAVRACGQDVADGAISCTVWARPDQVETQAAADALMYDYDPNTAYWDSSWWNSAVTLQTLIDYLRQTGDLRYRWVIDHTYTVNDGAFPAGARSGDPISPGFISQATDDTEWWALAWIDAYDLTGKRAYLTTAVNIATHVTTLWDNTCGGGVWWNASKTYKNAVTNGLFIVLTAELHQRIPGDTTWGNWASTAWNWYLNSGLINSSGLVNDGLDSSTCANNGQTVWSYNQGLAIGAGVEVWRATGDTSALNEASTLAQSAINSPALVTNGVLTESCDALNTSCDDNQKQFKGVFMRYLQDLNSATNGQFAAFAQAQASSVWGDDRTALNQLGVRWDGQGTSQYPNTADWRTQASALSALLAGG